MQRQVRKVPAQWQHPKDENGRYIPLFDGAKYAKHVADWDANSARWADGLRDDCDGGWRRLDEDLQITSYADWHGERPKAEQYMPIWSDEQATHLMMYEETTEGTPISPAFQSAEQLARWLADNRIGAFSREFVSYQHWLAIIENPANSLPLIDGLSPSALFVTRR